MHISDEDLMYIAPNTRYECQDCCFSTTSAKRSGEHDREENHSSKEAQE